MVENVISRFVSPTPLWFKRLRNIGIVIGALGAVLLSSPVALPAGIITLAGYLTVAGGVMGAVCQSAVAVPEMGV